MHVFDGIAFQKLTSKCFMSLPFDPHLVVTRHKITRIPMYFLLGKIFVHRALLFSATFHELETKKTKSYEWVKKIVLTVQSTVARGIIFNPANERIDNITRRITSFTLIHSSKTFDSSFLAFFFIFCRSFYSLVCFLKIDSFFCI
jgi:hypothetical protein